MHNNWIPIVICCICPMWQWLRNTLCEWQGYSECDIQNMHWVSCTQIRQLKDFIQTNWYSHSIFSSAHPFRSRSQIMRTISWYNLVFRSDLCVVVVIAKGIYIYVYYLHIVKTINPNHFAFRFLGWDTLFGTIDIINDCCDRNADV